MLMVRLRKQILHEFHTGPNQTFIHSVTYLEPAPSYYFIKLLPNVVEGFTRHETIFECTVSHTLAIVGWYKGSTKLTVSIFY